MGDNSAAASTSAASGPRKMPKFEMTEDIVISGVSGRFPDSDNIDELKENLFNHVDMVTEDDRRWPIGLYGLPSRSAKIRDLSKFDAQFFGVHGKQANLMDPQARMLLELTYESICDAGYSPHLFRGSRTGVFIGACISEVEEGLAQDVSKVSGYALTGCTRSMFANRISYTFDFHGPSYAMDSACSSALLALHQAVLSMRSGQCDRAIVGGVNICLRPVSALQFHKLGMLSQDGRCKFLDASGNGYVRAETCSVVFLQRRGEAKRIYATIAHTKTNTDGYKEEGITFPSWSAQRDLLKATYEEAGIDPATDVNYIECHGTGTKAGDPQEIRAVTEVCCPEGKRSAPLLVGSVKTNLGHSEAASGMNSLAKMLIAFENKKIPAILHFSNPNPDIEPLMKNLIKPVTENLDYEGGIVGVNSFGFGGVNVHAILKSFNEEKSAASHDLYSTGIPRLVTFCGRTEGCVNHMFDWIEQNPATVTCEYLALANDVSKTPGSTGMNYRGYMILKDKPEAATEPLPREVARVSEKRPLWFVCSGMGSQWVGMAKGLMALQPFAESIARSSANIKPYGIDLESLILGDDPKSLDTVVGPFVAIAAVQIALIDILRLLGIEPDGIVGHSVGELACAYADGCLDARQMLLAAYSRGKAVDENKPAPGLMAAVGLTWEEAKRRCPEGVVPACHNSEDSVTISGAHDIMKTFLEELRAENIFAREVKSSGVAYHSYFMNPLAPHLLKKLEALNIEKRERSSRWICSSVPESRWGEEIARYSAAAYYVNNLTSPVLFAEAIEHVPRNAICIEIAPHALLQPIVKRALGAELSYVGLMKRNNNPAALDHLLGAIGKLYELGLHPHIERLYPTVSYPVPRGTPSLSPHIQWDHSQSWLVTQYPEYFNPSSSSDYTVKVDLNEAEDEYIAHHCIDGRVLYPATGYLVLAWKMLAKMKGQFHDKLPVAFENVTLHRATILNKNNQTKFVVRMMETSGAFSISEGGTIVATGRVYVPEDNVLDSQDLLDEEPIHEGSQQAVKLANKDIYKEFRVRGYDYGPSFAPIQEATSDGTRGKVNYSGNWITLADALLQFGILGKDTRALFLPVRFQSVRCDPNIISQAAEESSLMDVAYDPYLNTVVTKGLEIKGLKTNIAPRRQNAQKPTFETYQFLPYVDADALDAVERAQVEEYVQVCGTLARRVLERSGKSPAEAAKILSGFKEADSWLLKRYLEAPADNHILLRALRDMISNLDEANVDKLATSALSTYGAHLASDLLANVVASERILRASLDVVIQNLRGRKLNLLEISTSSATLAEPIIRTLAEGHLSLKYEYTLSTPSTDSFPGELADKVSLVPFNMTSSSIPSGAAKDVDLVVYRDAYALPNQSNGLDEDVFLDSVFGAVRDNGFFLACLRSQWMPAESLVYEAANLTLGQNRVDTLISKAVKAGFSVVAQKSDSLTSVAVLFRKISTTLPDLTAQTIIEVLADGKYEWVETLKEAVKAHATKNVGENIWLVARDTISNGIVGLVNALRHEEGGDRIRAIFAPGSMPLSLRKEEFKLLVAKDLVFNVLQKKEMDAYGTFGHLTFSHEFQAETCKTEHAYLNVMTRGDLSSLRWVEAQHKFWPLLPAAERRPNETMCRVYYAPLNFRDIMLATGKLPPDALPGDMAIQDCVLGLEFAGRDDDGRRVMGLVPAKGLATTVIMNDPDFMWPIPENWTMEEASTVPAVYSTAYYALVVRGGLQPSESVLIHSGSGGVGQAAISIALSMGCTVYTTVGSQEKRNFLMKEFPQLTEENFANSRDTSFEQHVLRATDGRGVDIILNSLSDEKLQASVRCLAIHGRFLEIGKFDLSQNNPLGMSVFLKNTSFHGILLDSLFVDPAEASPGIIAQKQEVCRLVQDGIKVGTVRPLKRTIFEKESAEEAFRYMGAGKHMGKVVIKIRDEEPQAVAHPTPLFVSAIPRTALNPTKSYVVTGGLGGFGLELLNWLASRGANKLIVTSRSGPRDGYQHMTLARLRRQGVKVLVHTREANSPQGAQDLLSTATKELGPVGGIFNLAMVLSDALLENQTPESFQAVSASKVEGVASLDAASRRLCFDLEYFVAFSSVSCGRGNVGQSNYAFANSSMERVCEERRRLGLPGLAIEWGAIGDVGVVAESMGGNNVDIGGTEPQRIPSCFAAMDRFLQSPYPVTSSIVRAERSSVAGSSNKSGLLEMVSRILGVRDMGTLRPETTLGNLGMDSLMSVEIKQILEREYDYILSNTDKQALTIAKLIEIGGGAAAAAAAGGPPQTQIPQERKEPSPAQVQPVASN